MGRTIKLDNIKEIIYPSEYIGSFDPKGYDIKIVTYVYDLSCSSCGLRILLEWDKLLKEIGRDVGFVVIAHSEAKDEIRMALDELQLDIPIFCDPDDTFIKDNSLSVKAIYRTFLLDKNNRVVLVGEPLKKTELWELYKETIHEMSDNDGVLRKRI